MKKTLLGIGIGIGIGLAVVGYNYNVSNPTAPSDVDEPATLSAVDEPTAPPAEVSGPYKLCLACHKIKASDSTGGTLGPSYTQVATHYQDKKDDQATIDTLANKVKNGGDGVWESLSPMMTPNPVTDEQAKIFVNWILSLPPLEGEAANSLPLTK